MVKRSFIISEVCLYLLFITMDLLNINSTYIKYLGIFLCFLYAVITNKKRVVSCLFTLIADFFLLVIDKYYEVGLLAFIVVQLAYLYFLGNNKKRYLKGFIIFRCVVVVAGLIVLYFSKNMSLLNVLVLIYFSSLFINTIQSYTQDNLLFKIGLTLFVCCDICVGLHNISSSYTVASFMMWVFYLPSQVLIALS